MTKIGYLRKRLREEYEKRSLPQAAEIGDALLAEHMYNGLASPGYANDLYNVALVNDELDLLEKAAAMYAASARHINQSCPHQNIIFLHSLTDEECESLAMRFNNLAGVLARMGDLEQAYDMYKWVKSLNLRTHKENGREVTDVLYNMGNTAANAGKTEDALGLHGQALDLRRHMGIPEDILHSLHSIAHIYEETGEYEKAISFAEMAIEYAEGNSRVGGHHYLAQLYEANGQYELALELYDKVLAEISKSGCMRRDYMAVLSRRAYLTGKTGGPEEAIKLHQEVFDMYNSLTGLDLEHLDTSFYANCLRNMAVLNKTIGQTGLAEDYMLKSIQSRKAAGGEVIKDICFLIRLYLESDAYDKLMDVLVYALMQAGGSGDPNAASVIDSIMESFQDADNAHVLLEAIRETNDSEKIRPIIDMWRQKGGFV